MSILFHISPVSGPDLECDEAEFRQMWEDGLLGPGSLYWTQGMSDWKPVVEYFESNPEQGEFAIRTRSDKDLRLVYTKNPHLLTNFLVIFMCANMLIEGMSFVGDFIQHSLLTTAIQYQSAIALENPDDLELLAKIDIEKVSEDVEANEARQEIVGYGSLLTYVLTIFCFLWWVSRTARNLQGFGIRGLSTTPGWAIGNYFVPIMNLVAPYSAMQEAWRASKNPQRWSSEPRSLLVKFWWAFFLITGYLGNFAFRFSLNANDLNSLKELTVINMISSILELPLCLLVILMIKRITNMQEAHVSNYARKSEEAW